MIEQLRVKLITVTTVAVALMLTVIFTLVNALNYHHTTRNADEMLAFIAQNNGIIPQFMEEIEKEEDNAPIWNGGRRRNLPTQFNEESRYQTRYFIVQYDKERAVLDINTSHVAAVSNDSALTRANKVLRSGYKSGYSDMYRYLVRETDFGEIVIFLDCSIQLQSAFAMVLTSCVIAIICLGAIFIVIFVFSKRVIRPMIDNIERQKRFVTDAGHELKTPLAIISANVEVMELMDGSNEWLDSIKNQVTRMDKLVKSMLQLARMDETTAELVFTNFDLAEAFHETAEPFKIMATQKGRTLRLNAPHTLPFYGDENAIKNLISILIDNAIKYSNEDGEIDARIKRSGKSVAIEVLNTAQSVDEENLERLFDRFYRPDSSRSRNTGGYGIGLSMARRITESHKGRIYAEKAKDRENAVIFRAVFKANPKAAKAAKTPKSETKTKAE